MARNYAYFYQVDIVDNTVDEVVDYMVDNTVDEVVDYMVDNIIDKVPDDLFNKEVDDMIKIYHKYVIIINSTNAYAACSLGLLNLTYYACISRARVCLCECICLCVCV